MADRSNRLRNFLGGVGLAHGWSCGTAGLILIGHWYANAPMHPVASLGETLPHNNHGRTVYLSAFQSGASGLLLAWGGLLFVLGFWVVPKRNCERRAAPLAIRWSWDPDDPDRVGRWGWIAGGTLTLALLLFGSPLVPWLVRLGLAPLP